MTKRLLFIDTETTGLNPERHELWEIAAVERVPHTTGPGAETRHRWFVRPEHLDTAEPVALEIGHFYERFPTADTYDPQTDILPDHSSTFAREFEKMSRGATLVGANVRFDERFLNDFLRRFRCVPGWSYRLLDVEALTQGYMGLDYPVGLAKCANILEIPNEYVAHEALSDALLARDVYDAVVNDRFGRRKS